jgi:RHS repeat-associated protein
MTLMSPSLSVPTNAWYTPYGGNTYSVENRLTLEVLQNSGPYPANIYAYDPWGKRVMSGYNPSFYSPQPTYNYTFYGVTGQKLAMVTCNGSNYPAYATCAIVGQNVYFGKKLITAGGVNVLTDRLGSVRANGQGESSAYYPYGEERTSTVDGREKFGTYFRDAVGQDYADQRYYGSGTGSFFTPDRQGARPNDPISWNKYAFVAGDPINRTDRHGSCYTDPPPEHEGEGCYGGTGGDPSPGPANCAISGLGPGADDCGNGGGGGGGENPQEVYTEAFFSALQALQDPNCAAIFNTNPNAKNTYAPADVLATMGFGASPLGGTVPQGAYLGSIQFQPISLAFLAVTVPDPATSVSTGTSVVAASANIVLQSNPLSDGYFGTQSVSQLALTLIHELGHVYNIVSGLGGSKIIWDSNADGMNQDAEDQNAKTLQACKPK